MRDAVTIAHAGADTDARTDTDAGRTTDATALPHPHAYAKEDVATVGGAPRRTAIVGCVDAKGRILIVKQLAGPFAGAWLLPGGSVEPDERLEDAARRELFEETGYRVDDLTRVAQYEVRSVPAGRFHFLVQLFRGGGVTGTPKPERGGEVRWATPSAVDPNPNLALALLDLGFIERDRAEILRELDESGVEMRRVP